MKGVVLYTDGGCDDDGVGGYGVHGYAFEEPAPTSGYGCRKMQPTSLGYSAEAPKPLVTILNWVDIWGGAADSTNNRQELSGAIAALTYVKGQQFTSAVLLLDSDYVRLGITEHIIAWKARDWKKSDRKDVTNKDLWVVLDELYQGLLSTGVSITWIKVSGHSGEVGNDKADENCYLGKLLIREGKHGQEVVHVSEPKGYWNPQKDINRMFSKPKWYFNTGDGCESHPTSKDGRFVYYLGCHGKDNNLLGKRISDNDVSVVFVAEQDPILETVRGFQQAKAIDRMYSVIVADLAAITNPTTYDNLRTFGMSCLQRIGIKTDIFNHRKTPLTEELRPPRIAFRAIDFMNILAMLLEEYLVRDSRLTYTDVTDTFYSAIEDKKGVKTVLKGNIKQNTKSMKQRVLYNTKGSEASCDVTLTMGIDIADRNTLAALADRHPKVHVITWRESDIAFRYATVIEAGPDVGIWAGIFSNLRKVD